MKRFINRWALPLLIIALMSCSQENDLTISIIPKPASVIVMKGQVNLTKNPTIQMLDAKLTHLAEYLQEQMRMQTGLEMTNQEKGGFTKLSIQTGDDWDLGKEGYTLLADKKGIQIQAQTEEGLFYGIQSLLQLAGKDGVFQAVDISDHPRFAWRGFMLDVSRHFFSTEYIYKVLDYMAFHKLNTFHWHLVDDQGWRIEIKKYPLLTDIGAWRVDREKEHWNSRMAPQPGESATYGGFYTQQEIREIVAYASERHITIIPEIEMPGHTTAALAAYPQYSCTGGPFHVPPGGVWPITDIFCAGKDETFSFIEDILLEVIELFPSEYIHIGGDEANKKEWIKCPKCQTRIKNEDLANEDELQSYFITRIEKFINAHGRKIIGWDEILEGGLAPNAAVMSWRGTEGGIEAARSGHPVVMSPTSHCYFDYYQGERDQEPLAIGGFLPLEKVYEFDPVPTELNQEEAGYIIGVQANLWTEYIGTPEHADYMTFPRLCALSEVAWTKPALKDFDDFEKRLHLHLDILDIREINYSKSFLNVSEESAPPKQEL